ncbi:RHS repeat domain-containing protein, partial [Joostella sp. CR20]|uniref:RHS repeat domain-containing protein n=1 Tax=Joostella sp. CR20 TaxID=2804312 RepID=UPI00313D1ED3
GQTDRYTLGSIAYDKNGNITSLVRNGHINGAATSFGTLSNPMDKLSYTYHAGGNFLVKVSDTGNKNYGFIDGSNTDNDYGRDVNGNLIRDKNKGITNITYNHLNLPTKVTTSEGSISYFYDATGVKLKKVVSSGATTDYAGNYIYENGNLQFFNHAEGYVDAEGSGYNYVYQYKDHLGNVRLSYQDADNNGSIATNEIVEESNYYPFGLQHRGYGPDKSSLGNSVAKKFKYNGVELEETLGLNIYEMDFRQYDSSLGRFNAMDMFAMLAPSVTPYRFAFNNPVYWSDPSGLYEIDNAGNIVVNNENGNDEVGKLLAYLQSNNGASIDDIASQIVSSGEFAYDLEGVTVVGSVKNRDNLYQKAANDLGGQLNSATSRISAFNGNIVVSSLTNANPKFSRGIDYASGALTGLAGFSDPSRVVSMAMNAQVRGSNLSNGAINNLARTNQLAKGTRAFGRAAPAVSVGFALYDISNAYALDGSQFGYNSTITTSRSVGSIAGGWAGAEAGAAVGASIGLWFGGVGAVPGSIIGGIVGGVIGSHYGGQAGEIAGEQIAN